MQPFEVIQVVLQRCSVACFCLDEPRHVNARGEARLQRSAMALWRSQPPLLGGLHTQASGRQAEPSQHQQAAQLRSRRHQLQFTQTALHEFYPKPNPGWASLWVVVSLIHLVDLPAGRQRRHRAVVGSLPEQRRATSSTTPGRPLRMGSLLSDTLIPRKRCSGPSARHRCPGQRQCRRRRADQPRALESDPSAGLPRPTSAAMGESVTGRGTDAAARSTPALAQNRRWAGCRRRRSPLINHWASSGQPEDPALHHLAAMAGRCGEPGGGGLSGAFP